MASLPTETTLYFGPWYRRSPFFAATLRAGCTAFGIYNHMQGPLAAAALVKLVGERLLELEYYRCDRFEILGVPVIVSRTGWSATSSGRRSSSPARNSPSASSHPRRRAESRPASSTTAPTSRSPTPRSTSWGSSGSSRSSPVRPRSDRARGGGPPPGDRARTRPDHRRDRENPVRRPGQAPPGRTAQRAAAREGASEHPVLVRFVGAARVPAAQATAKREHHGDASPRRWP